MISVQGIWKQFGSQVVLRGVDLEIVPGSTTAVVGPSGVGKSVLLKLIMGVMTPEQGDIHVCGESITKVRGEREKNRIRSHLGVLFQSAALLDSLTVYENVAFPLHQHTELDGTEIYRRVYEMLDALSLCPYAAVLPQQISLGMRKRVGLARALILKPEVLLIDEPNTGLDPLVGQEVYDLIKLSRERWGFTGVVISHELPEVFQVSDRVAMLFDGNFIAEGTVDEIRQSPNPAVQQFLQGRIDGPIKIQ